ncbi:MAG: hypothetical protein IMY72_04925 [Bacteroidetes bacterium]|nr:hypothetical protein [Bacteroidota bacterium]
MIIKNSHGLIFEFLNNGSVKSIEVDPIRISLESSSPFSLLGANIFLRKRTKPYEYIALTGSESNSVFSIVDDRFMTKGSWANLDYLCCLQLSKKSLSWQWSVEVKNLSDKDVELDLIYVQDAGLKSINEGLINEYYVSQYLERLILKDKKYGSVICCRQNMQEFVGYPWLMMACKNGAVAASVDGMQFYGKTFRETRIPEGLKSDKLGGEYSGESSVLALQQKPFSIASGQISNSVFVATYFPNHPKATSVDDLKSLPDLMLEFDDKMTIASKKNWKLPIKNLFNTSPFLPVNDLNDKELNLFFGKERRHYEKENGKLLSFFSEENNHVVLRAKEIMVDRPHGHIMQAKTGLLPNENIVSTSSNAYGVFNSHLTQGNTNFNILLSVCNSQFNLAPETGQRIFVKLNKQYYLLGIPSAFEIGLNHCRWIYKFGDYCFQIRTWTSKSAPQVNLDIKELSGNKVDLLITHHFDKANNWNIISGNSSGEYIAKPKVNSMISGKFSKAQFRIIVQSKNAKYKACNDEVLYSNTKKEANELFVFDVNKTSNFCMSFIGEVCNRVNEIEINNSDNQWLSDTREGQNFWNKLSLNLSLNGEQKDVSAINEILPWYGMNALTHFLTPYGLEQFSGAAWGTRDVSQGPIDLLLSLEKYAEARKLLQIIFSNQNPDGGWPQWWMFDSYTNIRAQDAHGDVAYWCIIALSKYIKVTGDLNIIDDFLPYYNENALDNNEKTPLSEHVERLIKMIVDSFIPGTALVPYGGGDWNDSLQPVSKELAKRMISSWTVEMNYQAFDQYKEVYKITGNTEKANELKVICEKIKADFNKYLIKDGVVAGYGLIEDNGSISVLLHPTDQKTGIHYSILPMNRGIISGIFSKEQVIQHQEYTEQHLKGPDGARLMDHPLEYRGGIQTIFQRAESSTFFGREIGLMYVHEHIRYAESLAITGKADAFVKALRQAIPVDYKDIVPCGDVRQSNCYYSSSDVVFKNRYDAYNRYDEIKTGKITLRGGWRVYSSGPGIYIGIIISRLIGLRTAFENTILDPVISHSLNNFSATIDYLGHNLTFIYEVRNDCFSPKEIIINDKKLNFKYEDNQYRKGGAVILTSQFLSMADKKNNIIKIIL